MKCERSSERCIECETSQIRTTVVQDIVGITLGVTDEAIEILRTGRRAWTVKGYHICVGQGTGTIRLTAPVEDQK